jgi:hypothetical protein
MCVENIIGTMERGKKGENKYKKKGILECALVSTVQCIYCNVYGLRH